jgi:hypothetical protein
MMLYTTLNNIRDKCPCESGWAKLLNHLGKTKADDEQLSFKTILESNGLDDAIWCLRSVEGYDREIRLFAVACARRVEHFDKTGKAKKTNDVSERFANGLATTEELKAAMAAWAVAMAARDDDAAMDAAAMDAAWAAAMVAMDAAAMAAAMVAMDAAMAAAMDAQKEDFIKMFCTEE